LLPLAELRSGSNATAQEPVDYSAKMNLFNVLDSGDIAGCDAAAANRLLTLGYFS
jgi:hypothetical protein